jgi:hypothetical protein
MSRRSALLAALVLVSLAALGTGPIAVASAPTTSIPTDDPTPIDDVVDTVDGAVDTVEDTVEDVTEPVEDVTDPVVDTVEDAVEDVEEVTDPVLDTVEDVAEPVEDAVDTITGTVTGTVGDGSPSAGDPVGGGAGFGHGRDSRPGRPTAGSTGGVRAGGPAGGDVGNGSEAEGLGGTDSDVSALEVDPARASTPEADPSLLEDVANTITEIATRLAFPLALALVVLAFLGVQGRLDQKDPKLALAPVDSLQEYMSFR